MNNLLTVIDCGTTQIKAAIFDEYGSMKGFAEKPCPSIFHNDGRIEHDPKEIIKQAFSCIKEAVKRAKASPKSVSAISVTNQRATVACIDKEGIPIGNAISWQDMTGNILGIGEKEYFGITGIPNNAIFSLSKILKIQKTAPALFGQTARFVLVHDLLMKEFGCEDFISDYSNASLTGMLDISNLKWSKEILDLAGISEGKLSKLVASGTNIGKLSKNAARQCGLVEGIPLIAGGGDQQCGGLGAGCVKPGITQISLGTASVAMIYSHNIVLDPKMRISCCVHSMPNSWELEGLQNSAGASIEWAKHLFNSGLPTISDQFIDLLFFPYLGGASAPNWNQKAKGIFYGLTHKTSKEMIFKSIMEGVSFETMEILGVFAEIGVPTAEIRLTGGYSNIKEWCQVQADIFGKDVSTLQIPQATLLGAAMLAAFGIKIYDSLEEASSKMVKIKETFRPRKDIASKYANKFKKYNDVFKAVENTF